MNNLKASTLDYQELMCNYESKQHHRISFPHRSHKQVHSIILQETKQHKSYEILNIILLHHFLHKNHVENQSLSEKVVETNGTE